MKFRLVEDIENNSMESFYGVFKVTFPTDAYVTSENIEQMIKDNIFKYTDGEIDDITVCTEEEKDAIHYDLEKIIGE